MLTYPAELLVCRHTIYSLLEELARVREGRPVTQGGVPSDSADEVEVGFSDKFTSRSGDAQHLETARTQLLGAGSAPGATQIQPSDAEAYGSFGGDDDRESGSTGGRSEPGDSIASTESAGVTALALVASGALLGDSQHTPHKLPPTTYGATRSLPGKSQSRGAPTACSLRWWMQLLRKEAMHLTLTIALWGTSVLIACAVSTYTELTLTRIMT